MTDISGLTPSQTQYLCGAVEGGGSPACTLQFCVIFLLSVSSKERTCSVGATSGDSRQHPDFDRTSPTPRGGENTSTDTHPRCKGEARPRGLQICGASAWFSCDFFSSFTSFVSFFLSV